MLRNVCVPPLAIAGSVAMAGCLQHPLKPVSYEAEIEITEPLLLHVDRDVDILFVIDNSGSMADEQRILSQNFEKFIATLERPDVKANYRIGVTTTDVGNPACTGSNATTPEMGKLQMTSCRDRLHEFVFIEDDQSQACLDVCTRDEFEVLPSEGLDGQLEPRRWLESIEGQKNIPDDWTAAEAFGCFGPQGIAGCGFESPLESMYRALKLTNDSNSSSFGFLRPNAILAVVLVTDELDCSHNPDHREIFTSDNQEFWADGASLVTSAICWHAGVECSGDGVPYDECHSVDLDVTGNPVDGDDAETDAVLYPVRRYIDYVTALQDEKQDINPARHVIVSVLGGVPHRYHEGEAELAYTAAQSENQAQMSGVEPGCTSDGQDALPPVRLREFAEAFEFDDPQTDEIERNLYSICDDDYSVALDAVAQEIIRQLEPACFQGCVLDTDAYEPGLQVGCSVTENVHGTITKLPECERDDDGTYARENNSYVVPDEHEACYVLRTDPDGSNDDDHDDMAPECVAAGLNLQFDLQRRAGVQVPVGADIRASCQLSPAPTIDCPR